MPTEMVIQENSKTATLVDKHTWSSMEWLISCAMTYKQKKGKASGSHGKQGKFSRADNETHIL